MQVLCLYFNWVDFFVLSFRSSLYILDMNPSVDM